MIVIPFIDYLKTVSNYDYGGHERYRIYDGVSVESTLAFEGIVKDLYICFQRILSSIWTV